MATEFRYLWSAATEHRAGWEAGSTIVTTDPAIPRSLQALRPMQALLATIVAMDLPTQVQRIFHGRGGRHPGCEHLVLDAFLPVFVLTSFAALDTTAWLPSGRPCASAGSRSRPASR